MHFIATHRSSHLAWIKLRTVTALLAALFAFGLDTALALGTNPAAIENLDLFVYLEQHATKGEIDPFDPNTPPYKRRQHFGTWVNQNVNGECVNTRAEVLRRDADPTVPLQWKNSSGCLVYQGLWHDPYSGQDVRTAEMVQIDHVVPLKNAYLMGAHKWRPAMRCHYANFIKNDFNLRAVSGHENMVKSDRTPSAYLPPNLAFRCQYISEWMKIKAVWELSATPSEIRAIQKVSLEQNCGREFTTISAQELSEQRRLASQPIEACERFEKETLFPSTSVSSGR